MWAGQPLCRQAFYGRHLTLRLGGESNRTVTRVLTRLVVEGYEQAVADVRAAGVTVSPEWLDHLGWGRACKIDIGDLFARWSAKVVETSGGPADRRE